jgi:hypothetical protein
MKPYQGVSLSSYQYDGGMSDHARAQKSYEISYGNAASTLRKLIASFDAPNSTSVLLDVLSELFNIRGYVDIKKGFFQFLQTEFDSFEKAQLASR